MSSPAFGPAMRPLPRLVPPLLLLALAACGDPAPVPRAGPLDPTLYEIAEEDRPEPGHFLRYAPPGPRGGGLDIAVTDYARPDGTGEVSLVGVVHVADPPYFERIQALLDTSYERVLFEAVLPADAADVASWQERRRTSPPALGGLQQQLVSWFGFVYQLDALDYDRDHFVHADMTEEEFRAAGGDAFLGEMDPEAAERGLAELPEGVRGTFDAVRALADTTLGVDGPLRSLARKMFAETMGTQDIGTALDMFPGLSELILDRRNEVAMARFDEVRARTEGRVAVFYGAAHMPDLETRLLQRGYVRTSGRWLRAWALRAPLPQ